MRMGTNSLALKVGCCFERGCLKAVSGRVFPVTDFLAESKESPCGC